jgi:hypothetical protein
MKNKEKFKLKIKLSTLPENEKKRLLFECFDILFAKIQANNKKSNENFEVLIRKAQKSYNKMGV